MGIILGGALGNLYERVVYGEVVDFIALGPIPLFNLADAGITVGLIGLVLMELWEGEKTSSSLPPHPKT